MSSSIDQPIVITYDIVDGPTADRLIDAFKYAYDDISPTRVKFTLVSRRTRLKGRVGERSVIAQVIGLRYASDKPGVFLLTANLDLPLHLTSREGFYDANCRRGTLPVPIGR